MNNKKFENVAIIFLVYIFISGIIWDLRLFDNFLYGYEYIVAMFYHINIYFFISDINLNLPTSLNINILNVVFYFLLLVSILIYFTYKRKEKNLLLFLISIFYVSNIINLIIFTIQDLYSDKFTFSFYICFYFIVLLKIFIFYYCLKVLDKDIVFLENDIKEDLNEKEYIDRPTAREILNKSFKKPKKVIYRYLKAHVLIRFLNYFIDTFLILVFISNYIYFIENRKDINAFFVNLFGEYMFIFLFLIYSFLYYFFTEYFLLRTPAKYLTSCIVLNYNSEKSNIYEIISRTICRKIPFEPFSYFMKEGLHDSISKTNVFMLKNNGIKRIVNFIILIVVITLTTIFVFYKDDLENQLKDNFKQNLILEKKDFLNNKINMLSSNDFLFMNNGRIYKVENIKNDIIETISFHPNEINNKTLFNFYSENKTILNRIRLSKKQIMSIIEDDINYIGADSLKILNVYNLDKPCLIIKEKTFQNDYYTIKNVGKSCKIISINSNMDYLINPNLKYPLILNSSVNHRFYPLTEEDISLFVYIPDGFVVEFEVLDKDNKTHKILFKSYINGSYSFNYIE
jgi:hypothetical protein